MTKATPLLSLDIEYSVAIGIGLVSGRVISVGLYCLVL